MYKNRKNKKKVEKKYWSSDEYCTRVEGGA